MATTSDIVQVLGGKAVLKKISTPAALAEAIRKGLPYASLEALLSKLRLPRSEAAVALNFPERTLARRRKEKRLRPDESDRVLRLARLFSLATDVLESEDNAAAWFTEPNRATGGQTPLSLVDTEIGARDVEDVLWQIAHGMVS